jgi:tRNA pseudouridine55 synthase
MTFETLDGVLPVEKPGGPTSHDIVAIARRALKTRRVGHTGTLDPFASGLMLLCFGQATRLAEYLTGLPKEYRATARLGFATTTDDVEGEPVAPTEAWRELHPDNVANALTAMVGAVQQVPPAFSAKKLAGERMYERARRGEVVEQAPVSVMIHEIRIVEIALPSVTFDVRCSSGTYVRALARDLGAQLGVGAHLSALRRNVVGDFRVEEAVSLDDLSDPSRVRSAWISPLDAVRHLPQFALGDDAAAAIAHGRSVPAPPHAAEGTPIVLTRDGTLVAIASSGDGALRPRKVFTHG